MEIKKLVVIIKLDDDKNYQVALNKKETGCVLDLIRIMSTNGIQVIDEEINTISID